MFRVIDQRKVIVFLLLFSLSLFLTLKYLSNHETAPEFQETTLESSTTPTPTPKAETISQASPDGSIILTLKTKGVAQNKTNYSLFVEKVEEEDSAEENLKTKQLIFSETLDSGTTVEVPFNTWSPDEQHFFIKQQNGASQKFMVFKASGEEFEDGPFLNVNEYYIQEEIPYDLSEITGWAAPYLLIVRTKEIDSDTESSSYWFDVSQQNFIQLSTRF